MAISSVLGMINRACCSIPNRADELGTNGWQPNVLGASHFGLNSNGLLKFNTTRCSIHLSPVLHWHILLTIEIYSLENDLLTAGLSRIETLTRTYRLCTTFSLVLTIASWTAQRILVSRRRNTMWIAKVYTVVKANQTVYISILQNLG